MRVVEVGEIIWEPPADVMETTRFGAYVRWLESERGLTFDDFHGLVTSPSLEAPDTGGVGKLAVFAGVREFPMRVKCATLGWHTLNEALRNEGVEATTE